MVAPMLCSFNQSGTPTHHWLEQKCFNWCVFHQGCCHLGSSFDAAAPHCTSLCSKCVKENRCQSESLHLGQASQHFVWSVLPLSFGHGVLLLHWLQWQTDCCTEQEHNKAWRNEPMNILNFCLSVGFSGWGAVQFHHRSFQQPCANNTTVNSLHTSTNERHALRLLDQFAMLDCQAILADWIIPTNPQKCIGHARQRTMNSFFESSKGKSQHTTSVNNQTNCLCHQLAIVERD